MKEKKEHLQLQQVKEICQTIVQQMVTQKLKTNIFNYTGVTISKNIAIFNLHTENFIMFLSIH